MTEAIRIAVLNFVHETVTFLPNDTTLDDFVHDGSPAGGEALLAREPRSYMGGFVKVAREHAGVELVGIESPLWPRTGTGSHVGDPDSCGPVRGRDQLSRAQRTATATRARVDRGAVVLAPGPHDGGGAARDLALLHAPERASDRSADRAGEPVVTAARGEARLHRRGYAARLALRRGRVPQRRDVQPAAHGMDDASVIEESQSQRSRPC